MVTLQHTLSPSILAKMLYPALTAASVVKVGAVEKISPRTQLSRTCLHSLLDKTTAVPLSKYLIAKQNCSWI